MLLFLAGGVLAATQAKDFSTQPIYYAVTAFLAFSSCFFACLIAEDDGRLDTIVTRLDRRRAGDDRCSASLGYFGLTGELFVKFDRATGGFQDPNVFGPFLIFPFVVLVRRALTRPLGAVAAARRARARRSSSGIFLSFSRAAWGLTVRRGAVDGRAALRHGAQRQGARALPRRSARSASCAIAVLVAVALIDSRSVGPVRGPRADRADYDAGHLGRFQRHAIGFNMMLDHPLGIGAIEFGRTFGEDEHDIWLKTLTTYGWLGFAAFTDAGRSGR